MKLNLFTFVRVFRLSSNLLHAGKAEVNFSWFCEEADYYLNALVMSIIEIIKHIYSTN